MPPMVISQPITVMITRQSARHILCRLTIAMPEAGQIEHDARVQRLRDHAFVHAEIDQHAERDGNECREVQPSSISTAIRIRSEWFLAPSFCLSRDVVLATVL
jgi:hypothetical protein